MPLTVTSDELYADDFESGGNPWKTSLPDDRFASLIPETDGIGNDFVTSTGPWWIDPNHYDPGAGYLNLIFFSYLSDQTGLSAPDYHYSGTTFSVDIRPTDFIIPPGAHLYFWFQSYDYSIARYVNYVMSATPIEDQLVEGEWRNVTLTLSPEDADWTALGSAADRTSVYGESVSVAQALSSPILDWGIFLFLGNSLAPIEASGSMSFDNVAITLDANGVRSFMERDVNAAPQRFDIAVSVDPVPSFDGVRLEASIAGIVGDELLSVANGIDGVSVLGSQILHDGILVGGFTGGTGSALVVTFNADATATAIDAVIYALAYSTSSDEPPAIRLVDVVLIDTGEVSTPVASFELRLVAEPESNADDVYSFTDGSNANTPIYDEGGADTIDASLLTVNASISLAPGYYPPGTKEIYTVGSTRIETVVGGGGNDFVQGSALQDTINGGSGNDTLYGGEQDDTLGGGTGNDAIEGGSGADLIDGGDGYDIVYFTSSQSGVVVDLLNVDAASEDFFVSVEAVSGTDFDDQLLGDAGGNLLLGRTGADFLLGREGDDQLFGQDGADALEAGPGADLLDGGSAADALLGGPGNDVYFIDDAGDVVTELAGEGIDEIRTGLSTFSLAGWADVENLTATSATGQQLTGNALTNAIVGSVGNDVIDGGSGGDSLSGGGGDDTLIGDQGNDTLIGGAGADTLWGGLGDDSYYADTLGDVVQENAGEGTDRVFASASYALAAGASVETLSTDDTSATGAIDLTGNELANNIYGNFGHNHLSGGESNDVLIGHSGNDTLDGGAGADTLSGGLGDDDFFVDAAGDTVQENAGQGTDRVFASASYALAAGVSVETFSTTDGAGTGAIDLTGNEFANNVYGNDGANHLYGGGGNDTLVAHGGNDWLDGGLGADSLSGGLGDDDFFVDAAGDTVQESAGQGTDRVFASVSYTLAAGVSVETLSTDDAIATGAIDLTGNEVANNVYGNYGSNRLNGGGGNDTLVAFDGHDILDGGTGADVLSGGLGDDHFFVDAAGDAVQENAGQGTDRIFAGASYALATGVSIETLSTTNAAGTAAINLTGNELANNVYGNYGSNHLYGGGNSDTLIGHDGNDILDGGTGADLLSGGLGNDQFFVDAAGDTVQEVAGQGADRAFASVSYALAAGVSIETLSTTNAAETAAINLTGNELANNVYGNYGNNHLYGGGSSDTLIGHDGNDILSGGTGADVLSGGLGDDQFFVDAAGDAVQESAGQGTDRVFASASYALAAGVSVETLSTTSAAGTAAIDLTGNDLANNLYGNYGTNHLYGGGSSDMLIGHDGNDILDGGTGADTLSGGLGDDQFFVDAAGDAVQEGAGQGTDRVFASVSYALAAGVSIETLSTINAAGTAAIDLTGNELANNVYGNHGNNHLYGGASSDTLVAFDGNDWLDGGTGVDVLSGGLGNDYYLVDAAGDEAQENAGEGTDRIFSSASYTLSAGLSVETLSTINNTGTEAIDLAGNELANNIYGNSGSNYLFGGSGDDTLVAHDGDDLLDGGSGTDLLSGGAGADIFRFTTALGADNVDTLSDYDVANDTVDLDDAVFASLAAGALAAGAFVAGSAAQDADDRIIYDSATGALLFDVDGSGSVAAVQFAALAAGLSLTASEFVVI